LSFNPSLSFISLVTFKISSILSIETTAFGICTKTIDDIIRAAIVVKEYSTIAVIEPISKVLFKTFIAPKKIIKVITTDISAKAIGESRANFLLIMI